MLESDPPFEEEYVNTQDPTWSGPQRLRTSDTEREEIATVLRAAMTEGRLTLTEGEERLGACYAAKFRDELQPLTADLPGNGRAALASTPEAVAATRRETRSHVASVLIVVGVLTGLWALSGAQFFWPIIPIFFLLMSLRHGRRHPYDRHRRHHPQRVAPWNTPDWR